MARALALQLPPHGWDVTLVAGSRSDLGVLGDATHFFAGIDVRPVSFDAALVSSDPLDPPAGAIPMQPSYEDRPGAPDKVFAMLDDRRYERQVAAWATALGAAGAADADALHLHHLTPMNEAATRVAPGVPVVGHVHGTELLMLEAIAAGPPRTWSHAEAWAVRLRGWAAGCVRLVVASPSQIPRAVQVLDIAPERFVVLPNGVDPDAFVPRDVDRAAVWRRVLVDAPRAWRPGGNGGAVRYTPESLRRLLEGVVVVTVSRFTQVKRLPLLIEAFARASASARSPAALVIVGGHPGEWEDEHPADTIARLGVADVFLAGWYDHAELPALLSAADLFALASVREQFGQVLIEAMASGLPTIAVDRSGPSEIVADGVTGWLVPPDDVEALAFALRHGIDDGVERASRGANARAVAVERYGWPALASRFAGVLSDVASGR